MRTVVSASPQPMLGQYVRAFAQRTISGDCAVQPMPAFLESILHFDFGDPLMVQQQAGPRQTGLPLALVGPHTLSASQLYFAGNIDSFAIFFQPMALWRLFRVPTSLVTETYFPANDVLGAGVAQLWAILAETPHFLERKRLAEAYLIRQLARERAPATAASVAATLLTGYGGQISITELAYQMNMCLRELERAFTRDVGITAKRFARLARFQAALDAKVRNPNISWREIAARNGYHDQMHLVHEFHVFCGLPPSAAMALLGDSRPDALASSHG